MKYDYGAIKYNNTMQESQKLKRGNHTVNKIYFIN